MREALANWLPPTVAVAALLGAALLNALDLIPGRVAAAIAVVALLATGAFGALAPRAPADAAPRSVPPALLLAAGTLWIAAFYYPFHCRLFPGEPLTTVRLDPDAAPMPLPTAGHRTLDLVLDAHLPMASAHVSRTLHYELDLVAENGERLLYQGELGDRWQTRRLGRRGTTQTHLEHLSTLHVIELPVAGALRLERVAVAGVPGSTLTATLAPHRAPAGRWLVGLGILASLGALAFDLWWDPRATPTAALVTATAAASMLVFTASGSGHPGLRDIAGAAVVGGAIGIPLATATAWIGRAALRARPSGGARRHA